MNDSTALALTLSSIDRDAVAFEFAHNHCGAKDSIEVLLVNCGITAHQFAALADDALFQKKCREYVKELTENGTSFALKARIMAEELLKTNYRLAKSPTTAASVVEKLISNTVRWAGLEKRPADGPGESSGPKISINIDLGNGTPTQNLIIDAAP